MSSDRQKGTKILIVDDQPDNLRLLTQMLVKQGYEVRKAINGSTALMGVKTFVPDLILLDINMPGLSGYEVCQQLKSDRLLGDSSASPQTKQIPVIFLSASDEVFDKVKAFKVGGVDYITKPFQLPEVLARVETQIKIKKFNEIRENLSRAIVHDLKNPLSVITFSSSSLIRQNCLEEKNLEVLQTINSTAQRLDSMLDELLIIAKMDTGRLVLHKTEVNIATLIKRIAKRFDAPTAAKQIKLICRVPDKSIKVSTDVNLIQRVVENLLSNAIKFSFPNSNIIIEADRFKRLNENNLDAFSTIIKVMDEGLGIESELKQQIFEPYNTGGYVSDVQQIGLGLSFCKMVIEAHGGEISVEDNYPQGAIFSLKL